MPSSLFNQIQPNQNLNPLSQSSGMVEKLRNIKNMINLVQNKPDPNMVMNMLSQQNPELAQILKSTNGGINAKQLFIQKAQQMGVDPNQIINMLNSSI